MQKKSKKALCLILCALILIVSLWYFNNRTIRIENQTICSAKVDGDVRIAVISDLHGAEFGRDNAVLRDKIEKLSPDMILVLGDMYSRGHEDEAEKVIKLLEELAKTAEVFVITGEHDNGEEYRRMLADSDKIHYLRYSNFETEVNGNKVCVYGIDNVYLSDTFDLNREFPPPDGDKLNILMAHIPSLKYDSFGADVIFSGDTHGGIVRLPFIGPLLYDGYFFPKLTLKEIILDKGLFDTGRSQLFVTSGLGNYPLEARLFNRPEICLITIKKESS